MSTEQLAVSAPVRASTQLAAFLGMSPDAMIDTIKAQCFKGDASRITDAQLAAFISIANEMGVNPLLPGMLYAYPSQGAVVPIMGPDGVYKKLSERKDIDSWEVNVFPDDPALPPTHAVALIYRKGIDRPIKYVAHLSEWRVSANPNWSSRPRHMLGIRALKQAARQVIHGLPGDEDDRIISEAGEKNVTPGAPEEQQTQVKRKEPPKRSDKGVASVVENAEKKVENATIEVAATETKQEAAKPVETAAEPAKVEATVVEAELVEEAQAVVARTEMKDQEKAKFEVNVVSAQPTPKGSVWVEVTGQFVGKIYQQGGAANPAWKAGAALTVSLEGKKNVTSGNIVPFVTSVI